MGRIADVLLALLPVVVIIGLPVAVIMLFKSLDKSANKDKEKK